MKKLGLIDVSTLLHPIRLAKVKKNFGVALLQKVLELKETLKLEEIILVRDYGKSRYRLELYPEYKGQRGLKELTSEEQDRLNLMKIWSDNLDKFPFLWKSVCIPNVEADDILGILYQDLKDKYDVIVCTTDKDIQNVIPHSNLYNIGKSRYFNLDDRKNLSKSKFGLYQILAGDAVDNIPSFLGEKSATILADNFATFKEMRDYVGDVNELIGVSPYNRRYIIKFLEDIKAEDTWKVLEEKLKLNYKLINIFKDKSNLNAFELQKYDGVLKCIIEDEFSEFEITEELEDFLEKVNEIELLNILEDMF